MFSLSSGRQLRVLAVGVALLSATGCRDVSGRTGTQEAPPAIVTNPAPSGKSAWQPLSGVLAVVGDCVTVDGKALVFPQGSSVTGDPPRLKTFGRNGVAVEVPLSHEVVTISGTEVSRTLLPRARQVLGDVEADKLEACLGELAGADADSWWEVGYLSYDQP